MTDEDKKVKIVSDEDWKDQAKKEKEKLDQNEQQEATHADQAESDSPGSIPPASFMALVNSLVIQALYAMGRLGDPSDNAPEVNLDLAKFHIDTLAIVEEKTKGNLSEEEKQVLSTALHEVRMQYVQCAQV